MLDHWTLTAFLVACVIQITPIFKCNPITSLFGWIGRAITHDVSQQIAELKKAQDEQGNTIDQNEKDRIRYEVLEFANSCRNGQRHTSDEFKHMIVLNEKYERLLKKTKDENGVFKVEYEYICDLFKRCQIENDFL